MRMTNSWNGLSSLELSGLWASPLSRHWPSALPRNNSLLLGYSYARFLASLCMSLARDFLLPLSQVGLIAIGLYYASAVLWAQHIETRAFFEKDLTMQERFALLRQSANLFPFNPLMRRAPAIQAAKMIGFAPPDLLYAENHYSLTYDPWSKDLIIHEIVYRGLMDGKLTATVVVTR